MSPAHTPGPWEAETDGHRPFIWGPLDAGDANRLGVVATAAKMSAEYHWPWQANAHLIAAAPTMYAYIATLAELGDENAQVLIDEINAPYQAHTPGRTTDA